ncbi:MAG: AEC family transporter [Oscillospiraceae bacterium]|nr:AEC family transporter [Oscillospiraceae bacterium]
MLGNLLFSVNVVLPLFLCCLVGYAARQWKLVDDKFVSGCSNVVFYIAIPANIFMSLMGADLRASIDLKLMGYIFGFILLMALVLVLLVPRILKDRATAATAVVCIFRSNFAMLGIPLATSLMGQAGALPTLIMVPFATLLYTVLTVVLLVVLGGQRMEDKGGLFRYTLREVLKNPLIVASAASILVAALKIPLPGMVEKTVQYFANCCTALSLFMLGAQLNLKEFRGRLGITLPIAFSRLVLVPAIAISVAAALGFRGGEMGCALIFFAAPTAVNSYVLAGRMGGDGKLAGDSVLVTTGLAALTLTAWIFVLKSFALL